MKYFNSFSDFIYLYQLNLANCSVVNALEILFSVMSHKIYDKVIQEVFYSPYILHFKRRLHNAWFILNLKNSNLLQQFDDLEINRALH